MLDQSCASARPKFLADIMLGSLARWLRILGYDTVYDNQIEDDEIIARSSRECRITLTRDRRLQQRLEVSRCLMIENDDLFHQIREVLEFLGHDVSPERLLTRCLRCNAPLERVSKDGIRPQVPSYVFKTQSRFKRCPVCQRIYWGGTHRQNIYQRLQARL
ncbi:MAG: Mut7-C RNAse domain-containing protein [Acidobacteria bacterium]|nr:Mut7-C RNAse domain-containing protein [Acidobacteriota bacterium]MCZ6878124.1 Mut7-C RNAse domain-containing protein [Acidobacteriota bacterium]